MRQYKTSEKKMLYQQHSVIKTRMIYNEANTKLTTVKTKCTTASQKRARL